MRSMFLALSVAVLSVVAWPSAQAIAQEEQVARGTVSDIGGSWVTVKVRDQALKFIVDSKTQVEARGGATKTREANAAGKPGPKLADVLKVGQSVAVSYLDMAGSLHASKIQAIPSVGGDGGSIARAAPAEMTSIGTVKSVAAGTITISGSAGGGGTFTQTFTIDSNTKVVGKGAGTAAAAKGGRAPFTDLIANGDRVSVSYHKMGDTLHASDVRVTTKGSGTR